MELRDIIEKVSEFYRNEYGKINELYNELKDIESLLVQDDIGDELSLSEYRRLINRKCDLQEGILRKKAFVEGISETRELLMDIGFDVKIERSKE